MHIIVPADYIRRASISSLFGKYEQGIRLGISKIVRKSFDTHPVRNLTDAVIKERIDFCIIKAVELYREFGWSSERIIDQLPAALKAKLNGTDWVPSRRFIWSPDQ